MQESPERKHRVRSGPPKLAYWLWAMTWETLRPVPIIEMMDSGPSFSWYSRTCSQMMSYASSQLTRSHLSSPRSPTRFIGYFRRLS